MNKGVYKFHKTYLGKFSYPKAP